MKLNEIINPNKKGKDILINISTILGITAVLMTVIMIIYQFAIYIYDMQWFHYWSIDSIFYIRNNTEIINGLLFGFSILCIVILFSLAMYGISKKVDKNNDNQGKITWKDKIYFLLMYIFVYFLLGLKDLYYYNFSKERIFIHIIGIIVSLRLMKFCSSKVSKLLQNSEDINPFKKTIKDLLLDLLAFIVAIFIFMVIFGNINSIIKNNYKIMNKGNECNAILYSTSQYYITAKCDIDENNIITVYKNTQIKIDNHDVEYQLKTFTKINKE